MCGGQHVAIGQTQPALGARATRFPSALHLRLAATGAVVCASSFVVATAGAGGNVAFGRGLLDLLIVGTPIAVGLYALRTRRNLHFGLALVGIGFAWSLTALAEAPWSLPYTIGRVSTWLTLPCVVYLLLAFPSGRIAKGLDRWLFAGVLGVLLLLYFGTVPLVRSFPPTTSWATCGTDCPSNAFFVLEGQPAFLTQVILVREWLLELLLIGVLVSMFRRWRAASALQRCTIGPVLIAGTLLALFDVAHLTARRLDAPRDMVAALSSARTFSVIAVCVAFLLGLLLRRVRLACALADLSVALRCHEDRVGMRNELANTLGDPTLELVFGDGNPAAWHDSRGARTRSPRPAPPGRAVTAIGALENGDTLVLAHDAALCDDPELLDGVTGMIFAGWRHERLMADLGHAMSDLEDSRRRIAEAGDVERVRIERNLHDGAQQRLVALRIRLGLVEEAVKGDPAGLLELQRLGVELEGALNDLRSLAHGVYPSLLADRGLPDALDALGRQTPMAVHIVSTGVTRHPIKIESAVYFSCSEALQNAMKHAAGATGVWIRVSQSLHTLRFEVRDDGAGFVLSDDAGRGLRNMHDRMEAVGGQLTIDTQPSGGTRVRGFLVLP